MDANVFMEILGYVGTALVLLSFLMSDLKWLRIFNMCGGFLSLIYAVYTNTMPVVVLNGSLITINAIQLARIIRAEKMAKLFADDHILENEKEEEK
jgi:lipid-A-disaccharide synthase-like uncharacterized protein